jgi:hypothetical protein
LLIDADLHRFDEGSEPLATAGNDRMKLHRIASVEPLQYPTLRVTFNDVINGILDLSDLITEGATFVPLTDEAYFRMVAVNEGGRTFGWNLDAIGHEIDVWPDTTRIQVETRIVENLASQYVSAHAAAARVTP